MIHHPFYVTFASSSYICVSWARSCVVFWNHVTIVGPSIFQMNDKDAGVIYIICSRHDWWTIHIGIQIEL